MLSPTASAHASGSNTKKGVAERVVPAILLGVPNNNSYRSYIAAYALNSVSFVVSRYHTRKNIAICCMVTYSSQYAVSFWRVKSSFLEQIKSGCQLSNNHIG